MHNASNIRHYAMQRLSGTMLNANIIRHHACKDYYAQCTIQVLRHHAMQTLLGTMQVLSGTMHNARIIMHNAQWK